MSINGCILFDGVVLMSRIGNKKQLIITGRKTASVEICADSPVTTVRMYMDHSFGLIDKETAP